MKKTSSKISVCFISETSRVDNPILDPSVRYRCFHPAENLDQNGYRVAVFSAKQFYERVNYDFDVYIFHRPTTENSNFVSFFEGISGKQKCIIADYDDLIFGSTEVAAFSSAVKNKTMTLPEAERAFQKNLDALMMFDNFSVSTNTLRDQILLHMPSASIAVSHNVIPQSLIDISSIGKFHEREWRPFDIGYFAGTRSHNEDVKIVEDVIYRILCENKDMTFLLVGPLELNPGLASHPNVSAMSMVGYLRLPQLMSHCDTVIAPLERTVFNECKSRVKFLEAAVAGCRLVASPIEDMKIAANDRAQFAKTKNDWYNMLQKNKTSNTDRINNYKYLLNKCSSKNSPNFLKKFIG